MWDQSPLGPSGPLSGVAGPMVDLMWATPDGRRRLVAPTDEVAAFVSAVYRFDEVWVTPLTARIEGRALTLEAPEVGLSLHVEAGRGWLIPILGPAWVTRLVAPLARRVLGVRIYGVSPTGVREWYRARWYRPVVAARARLAGRDLGELRPLDPPVNFGFSEPPRRPSMVWVRPLLHDTRGEIARALGRSG